MLYDVKNGKPVYVYDVAPFVVPVEPELRCTSYRVMDAPLAFGALQENGMDDDVSVPQLGVGVLLGTSGSVVHDRPLLHAPV